MREHAARDRQHHLDLGVRASTLRSAYGTSKAGSRI